MTTIKEWYARVNAAWPAEIPPLTGDEAIRAACKLYRFATRVTWTGAVQETTGNRYTYSRYGVLYVNAQRGWKAMVHELSHDAHGDVYNDKAHARTHARLELRMIKEVLKRGWLDGRLRTPEKPAPTKAEIQARRYGRLLERIVAWEKKEKRAWRAKVKLRRQAKAYLRRMSATNPVTP